MAGEHRSASETNSASAGDDRASEASPEVGGYGQASATHIAGSAAGSEPYARPFAAGGASDPAVGWDHVAGENPRALARRDAAPRSSVSAQVLSLFAEPGVDTVDAATASSTLQIPLQDAETALESLSQAGHLMRLEGESGPHIQPRFRVPTARKLELERIFHATAERLGETRAIATREYDGSDELLDDDEPRLPITAGILSLFLPGTGQLLNGDIGRASLIFAVWALAMLTPFAAIVTFVRLYAGAEAFFNAKIRRLERQQALREAAEKSKLELPPGARTDP